MVKGQAPRDSTYTSGRHGTSKVSLIKKRGNLGSNAKEPKSRTACLSFESHRPPCLVISAGLGGYPCPAVVDDTS